MSSCRIPFGKKNAKKNQGWRWYLKVVVTAIKHESVTRRRNLRISSRIHQKLPNFGDPTLNWYRSTYTTALVICDGWYTFLRQWIVDYHVGWAKSQLNWWSNNLSKVKELIPRFSGANYDLSLSAHYSANTTPTRNIQASNVLYVAWIIRFSKLVIVL